MGPPIWGVAHGPPHLHYLRHGNPDSEHAYVCYSQLSRRNLLVTPRDSGHPKYLLVLGVPCFLHRCDDYFCQCLGPPNQRLCHGRVRYGGSDGAVNSAILELPSRKEVARYLGLAPASADLAFTGAFLVSKGVFLVTIFSKNSCVQCDMTKRELGKRGVEFEEKRMDLDESYLEKAKEMGYLQAPVVILPDGTHWSGFRPDLIAKHF